MEGNIAATYALIYRFLKQQSQNKAAEAVKKAAKPFVVLRDDIEQAETSLEDIIKEWKTRKSTNSGDADSSPEDSESSGDSSSESEVGSSAGTSSEDISGSESEDNDTSDSDESDEGTEVKKLPPKSAVERDTSVTLSSGENAQEATKQVIQIPEKKKSTEDESDGSESDSSDSDSSDSGDSSKRSDSHSSDAETSSNSSDPSSTSDSSDEDEANVNAPQTRMTTTEDKNSSSSESSLDSEDESGSGSRQEEDVHVAKKRKTSESGAAVATESERTARPLQRKEKPPPKVRERFQRVKVQSLAPDLLLDNGYEARGGASNDYGERAHRDLVVTRGAGFRKEKNKKKRGSYRGGEITMENRSIKFDF